MFETVSAIKEEDGVYKASFKAELYEIGKILVVDLEHKREPVLKDILRENFIECFYMNAKHFLKNCKPRTQQEKESFEFFSRVTEEVNDRKSIHHFKESANALKSHISCLRDTNLSSGQKVIASALKQTFEKFL